MSNFVTTLLVGYSIYWLICFYRGACKKVKFSANKTANQELNHSASKSHDDIFLDNLTKKVEQANHKIESALTANRQEYKEKFDADIAKRDALVRFASDNNLDEYLLNIWDEIEHYPSWTKLPDYKKKLNITNVSGEKNDETEKVIFSYNGMAYAISFTKEKQYFDSHPSDDYAEITLYQDEKAVFTVYASSPHYHEYPIYSPKRIRRFIRDEKWIQFLIDANCEIKLTNVSREFSSNYESAERIKDNFQE